MNKANLKITFKKAFTMLPSFKDKLFFGVAMVVSLSTIAAQKGDVPNRSAQSVEKAAGVMTTVPQSHQKIPTLSVDDALKLIAQRTREDTDSGVVINQTMTVAGQNFYQHFMNAWRDKEGSERHTLVLRERPSARWGSEIGIEFGQSLIFRTRLSTSRAALKQMGEDAAEASYQNLLQVEARRQIGGDSDIANDEL